MPEEAFLPSAGTFPHPSASYRQRTQKELRDHDKKACREHSVPCSCFFAGCGIFRGAAPENTPAVPDDFSLRFSWWYDETQKNILDTQTGSIQKDLASDGTASAELRPEPDFLQRLYELVCKYRLTDIDREMTSQELADDKSKAVSMIPLEHYEISVTLNRRSLLICGDQTAVYHMTSDEDAANFINAVTSVKKAVTELPEWTALPPANGGYD